MGWSLLLPQHSPPASLARGDVFSSGNISGSGSGRAKEAALAVLEGVILGYYPAQFGTVFFSSGNSFEFKEMFWIFFFCNGVLKASHIS